MSGSESDPPRSALKLEVSELLRSDGIVPARSMARVYDARGALAGEGHLPLRLTLARGHYTVAVVRGAAREIHDVRLVEDLELSVGALERHSSVPTADVATRHEYHEGPAYMLSEMLTKPPEPSGDTNLMVFVRVPDLRDGRQAARTASNYARGLRLSELSGHTVTRFAKRDTLTNREEGWTGFNSRFEPGMLLLSTSSRPGRVLPLLVHRGWETRVFISHQGRPKLRSAVVTLSPRGKPFQAQDSTIQALELSLHALETGGRIDPGIVEFLLRGKFENPMLGIVGAHLLLREKNKEVGLVRIVLDNLHSLLHDSSDVACLRLAFGLPALRPDRPPMLRASMDLLVQLTAEKPDLIPEHSFMESVALRRYYDSVWNTWQPFPARKSRDRGKRFDAVMEMASAPPPTKLPTMPLPPQEPRSPQKRRPAEFRWLQDDNPLERLSKAEAVRQTGIPLRYLERVASRRRRA